jgi:hypothetical protein
MKVNNCILTNNNYHCICFNTILVEGKVVNLSIFNLPTAKESPAPLTLFNS